ncbi:hypothetical protein GGX14DRAFT_394908 [Mycena pura]|uniref:Secreted protein n=1 Tax=Mycena pura TaxID=153505 RepID=A0AAD6VF04_9AGAR|nr:hypothetical protein GGX14DRAFT_394908 [Mycena pura]
MPGTPLAPTGATAMCLCVLAACGNTVRLCLSAADAKANAPAGVCQWVLPIRTYLRAVMNTRVRVHGTRALQTGHGGSGGGTTILRHCRPRKEMLGKGTQKKSVQACLAAALKGCHETVGGVKREVNDSMRPAYKVQGRARQAFTGLSRDSDSIRETGASRDRGVHS